MQKVQSVRLMARKVLGRQAQPARDEAERLSNVKIDLARKEASARHQAVSEALSAKHLQKVREVELNQLVMKHMEEVERYHLLNKFQQEERRRQQHVQQLEEFKVAVQKLRAASRS